MKKSDVMNMRRALLVCMVVCCAWSVPALSHHSTAEFDYTKAYIVSGTVKEVQWTNPHAWIQLLVPNKKGGTDEWGFELGAPVFNIRMGWRKDSTKPGDHVKIVFCPSRARARGTLMQLILPDGTVLKGVAQTLYRGPNKDNVEALPPPPPLPPLPAAK